MEDDTLIGLILDVKRDCSEIRESAAAIRTELQSLKDMRKSDLNRLKEAETKIVKMDANLNKGLGALAVVMLIIQFASKYITI